MPAPRSRTPPPSPAPPPASGRVGPFAAASYLHDLGAEMVFSVWPLFLRDTLGASMLAVGLIDGLGEALVSVSQAVSGWLSDRLRKRKVFVWVGYLLGGVARVGYALAPTWPWVVPFRILDRSGKMRGAPRDAIVADLSRDSDRGWNFGVLRTMDNLGAVTGILLAAILLPALGFTRMFLLAAFPSLLAALIVRRLGPESAPPAASGPSHAPTVFTGPFRTYLLLSVLLSLGSFSYSFLLLAAAAIGIPVPFLPVLYLLYTLTEAVFSLPLGRLSDLIGRKPLIGFSLLCWGSVAFLFLIGDSTPAILSAFILYGLHRAALEPVQRSFVAEMAAPEALGRTLGLFQLATGLASLPASLGAGLLWEEIGFSAPFAASLVLTATAGLLLPLVRPARSAPAGR